MLFVSYLPAQNSSSAYPSTYCIPGWGQLSIAPFMTFGCVTKLSTTEDMALSNPIEARKEIQRNWQEEQNTADGSGGEPKAHHTLKRPR